MSASKKKYILQLDCYASWTVKIEHNSRFGRDVHGSKIRITASWLFSTFILTMKCTCHIDSACRINPFPFLAGQLANFVHKIHDICCGQSLLSEESCPCNLYLSIFQCIIRCVIWFHAQQNGILITNALTKPASNNLNSCLISTAWFRKFGLNFVILLSFANGPVDCTD